MGCGCGLFGSMSSTPTAAGEVVLGLPPLHIMTEAFAGVHRLNYSKPCKPRVL